MDRSLWIDDDGFVSGVARGGQGEGNCPPPPQFLARRRRYRVQEQFIRHGFTCRFELVGVASVL